jgi:hypothetical protein
MSNPDSGAENLDSEEGCSPPRRKLKLGKSLFKKGFTKHRAAKAWKTWFRRRHPDVPNQGFNSWTFPLVPFWGIGYCLLWLVLRIRELKLNLNLNDFRIASIFRFSFMWWGIQRLASLLFWGVVIGLWGVLFGLWRLLRGLWWTIKHFCLFVNFVVFGIPGFLRDCRYFVRKCTFPGWQGMNLQTRFHLMWQN